ncbi:adenosylmethionine decarboxylase [bacterium]|nr:adenosylmethionine decarboxylase [candidate division CSSED10-310 bacterium]
MAKGKHLLIDCRNVSRELLLNDKLVLDVMARAATKAGSTVISQMRYKFGYDSPPGFTAIVMLDESHCSAHCYADLGLMAMDVFTCGKTNPRDVLKYIREELDLGDVTVSEVERFTEEHDMIEQFQPVSMMKRIA